MNVASRKYIIYVFNERGTFEHEPQIEFYKKEEGYSFQDIIEIHRNKRILCE